MSFKNFIGSVAVYGAVFFAGYYFGGGCEKRDYRDEQKVERRIDRNERERLEDKIEELQNREGEYAI